MKNNSAANKVAHELIQGAITDPDKNLIGVLAMLEAVDTRKVNAHAYHTMRNIIYNSENQWNILFHNLTYNMEPEVLEQMLQNFGIHAVIANYRDRICGVETCGCEIPWAVLIDLNRGHQVRDPLDEQNLERIISEGTALGTYTYVFSGSDLARRKAELIQLAENYPDCAFLIFTDGSPVDAEFAWELRKAKNFSIVFSADNLNRTMLEAMDRLREVGVLFGFSACYTEKNLSVVGNDAFLNLMIEKGCVFGWYFTDTSNRGIRHEPAMMVEPQEFMYYKVREWRADKPCFLLDFQNDGDLLHNGISVQRHFLHINADGDIERCAFIRYKSANIMETSLSDALHYPMMMEHRQASISSSEKLLSYPFREVPANLSVLNLPSAEIPTTKETQWNNSEELHLITESILYA